MPDIEHVIYSVRQTLDDEIYFFQPLLYPELSHLTYAELLPEKFKDRVLDVGELTAPESFYLRTMAELPKLSSVKITVNPPTKMREQKLWIEPMEMSFEYVAYTRPDDLTVGIVPSLGLQIVRRGAHDGNFVGNLKNEIRSSLVRRGVLTHLRNLIWLDRLEDLTVVKATVKHEIQTPKQLELQRDAESDKESTLKKVALPLEIDALLARRKKKPGDAEQLRRRSRERMYEYDDEVSKLAELIGEPHRKSVLLVGPAGVGKTSLMRELAAQKNSLGLSELECWVTDGSRIVAGMSGFGQWQERCSKLVSELRKKNAVLHLGNLVELLEVGKSTTQVDGIASYLRTFIQRGTLLATAECTVEQLSLIEQQDPELLQCFHRLDVKAPDKPRTLRIFRKFADRFAQMNSVTVTDESLDTLYRTHRRYATYSDHPGRPLRFLRDLIQDSNKDQTVDSESVIKAFSNESGLPYFLLSESEPLRLAQTCDWFAQRVIGQVEPVELVTDMLAAVKSNLTPMGRPIASFLLIGPTGVGKTQMAKSLAEFMYQDDQRLIRFDMSEYNDRSSVERLIGGFGQPQGLLTSKVRQHPFSVVLFDEFEKAHRSFYDLLLQVLGEGRLTDGRGRTTDFSTSIIVMTSNLGVGSFRLAKFGFGSDDQSEEENVGHFKTHFEEAVQKFVRPELFNRIDRVVPFLPLSIETVRAVVRREIEQLKRREGIWFRGVELSVDELAVDYIATKARDPRYGARPIQRFLQQKVAVPLADCLNRYSTKEAIQANVSATEARLTFDVKASDGKPTSKVKGNDQSGVQVESKQAASPGIALKSDGVLRGRFSKPTVRYGIAVSELRAQRLNAQKLYHSSAAQRLRNRYYREKQLHERQIKKHRKNFAKDPQYHPNLEEISFLKLEVERKLQLKMDQINELDTTLKTAFDVEDELLVPFFDKKATAPEEVAEKTQALKTLIGETIYRLFLSESEGSDRVTLFVFSKYPELSENLIKGYVKFATEKNYRVKAYLLRRYQDRDDHGAVFSLARAKHEEESAAPMIADVFKADTSSMFSSLPKDLLGFALNIRGPAAFTAFSAERGLHSFKLVNRRSVGVEAIGGDMVKHVLPMDIESITLDEFNFRRAYDMQAKTIRDSISSNLTFDPAGIPESVAECVRRSFEQVIAKFVDS